MTERARRHRADLRPSTPLLTGPRAPRRSAAARRGGVIVAVSSWTRGRRGLAGQAATRAPPAEPCRRRRPCRLLSVRRLVRPLAAGADALAAAPVSAPRARQGDVRAQRLHGPAQARRRRAVGAAGAGDPRRRQRLALPAPGSRLRRRSPLGEHRAATRRDRRRRRRRRRRRSRVLSAAGVHGRRDRDALPRRRRTCTAAPRPRGFDCSGFTGYVFAQLGVTLARSADGQYRSVPRIAALPGRGRRPGVLPERRRGLPRRASTSAATG